MKFHLQMSAIALLLGLAACGSQAPGTQPPGPPQGVAVGKDRPAWTRQEGAQPQNGSMMFVGVTQSLYASEGTARNAAYRDAVTKVTQWTQTNAINQVRSASRSFGLTSATNDATAGEDIYAQQVSQASISGLKAQEYYMEWVQNPTGAGYNCWVLTALPASTVKDAAFAAAQKNAQDAQDKARAASDAQAKQQAQNAADFWGKFAGSMGSK